MCLRIYSVVSWLLGQVSIDQCDEKDIKISCQCSFKSFRARILLFHGVSAYLLTWLLSKAFQGTKWNFFFHCLVVRLYLTATITHFAIPVQNTKMKTIRKLWRVRPLHPKVFYFYFELISCVLPLSPFMFSLILSRSLSFTGVYLPFCFLPWNKLCNPVKMHNRLLEHGNELFGLYFLHGNWVSFLDFLFNVTWMY